jgi:hypothetical protein
MTVEMTHPLAGPVRLVASPIKLSATPVPIPPRAAAARVPTPMSCWPSSAVAPDEIAALRASGAI